MHISQETPEQTDARLRRVLAMASLDVDERAWWYEELPLADFKSRVRDDAIAVVRDDDGWSQLIPVGPGDPPAERFRVWTFHFPDECRQQRLRRLARHPHQASHRKWGLRRVRPEQLRGRHL